MQYWRSFGGDQETRKECIGTVGNDSVSLKGKEGSDLETWKNSIKLYWESKYDVYSKIQRV